jgi:chromosome segregation ATPase
MAALFFSLALAGCDKGAQAELENARAACEKAEAERDSLQTEMAAVTKTRDELQGQVTSLTEQDKQLRSQIDQLTRSDKKMKLQVTELTSLNKKLMEQIEEVTGSRNNLTKEVAGLRSSSEGLQTQIDDLTKQRDTAVAKEKEALGKIAELTAELRAATEASMETVTVAEPEPEVKPMVAIEVPVREEEEPEVEAVELPTIHSFDTASAKIKKGQSASLSWHVTNAGRINIEPDIGSVSALGSKNIKPSKTTTYTLTATNSGGETTATCTVEVR